MNTVEYKRGSIAKTIVKTYRASDFKSGEVSPRGGLPPTLDPPAIGPEGIVKRRDSETSDGAASFNSGPNGA